MKGVFVLLARGMVGGSAACMGNTAGRQEGCAKKCCPDEQIRGPMGGGGVR